jgi:hypothetical protein
MLKLISSAIICTISFNSFALVDYSQAASSPASNVPMMKSESSNVAKSANVKKLSAGPSGVGAGISFDSYYESQKVQGMNETGNINIIGFNSLIQTPYPVYLDLSYWQGNSDAPFISNDSNDQKGNPQAKIGFNWLSFGERSSSATVDLIAGYKMAASNSTIASSRSDKIVGVQTTKVISEVALGLGYEYYLTGTPGQEDEMDIGNIAKISAALMWRVSPDIKMGVEAVNYSIKASDAERDSKLKKDISFSYLAPQLALGLSPFVGLELGAKFRVKKIPNAYEYTETKIYDLRGAFGNSLFAKLNLSI